VLRQKSQPAQDVHFCADFCKVSKEAF